MCIARRYPDAGYPLWPSQVQSGYILQEYIALQAKDNFNIELMDGEYEIE